MADILDIDDFKKRKLAKAEADWDQYMRRAEEFQRAGKTKFAEEMMTKAKAARVIIDKLRGPVPKREKSQFLKQMNTMHTPVSFTFDGLHGHLSGYPKPTDTP
jgi:hypothetical protein